MSGSDVIPVRLLKECASNIAPILVDIFKRSRDVQADRLDANISTVFMKGQPDDPANYPISLISTASELLEHMFHKSFRDHLDYRDLLSDFQHISGKDVHARPN